MADSTERDTGAQRPKPLTMVEAAARTRAEWFRVGAALVAGVSPRLSHLWTMNAAAADARADELRAEVTDG